MGKSDGASSDGDRWNEATSEGRLLSPPDQPLVLPRSPLQSPALEGESSPLPLSLKYLLWQFHKPSTSIQFDHQPFSIFRCLTCVRPNQLALVCLLPFHLYLLYLLYFLPSLPPFSRVTKKRKEKGRKENDPPSHSPSLPQLGSTPSISVPCWKHTLN